MQFEGVLSTSQVANSFMGTGLTPKIGSDLFFSVILSPRTLFSIHSTRVNETENGYRDRRVSNKIFFDFGRPHLSPPKRPIRGDHFRKRNQRIRINERNVRTSPEFGVLFIYRRLRLNSHRAGRTIQKKFFFQNVTTKFSDATRTTFFDTIPSRTDSVSWCFEWEKTRRNRSQNQQCLAKRENAISAAGVQISVANNFLF